MIMQTVSMSGVGMLVVVVTWILGLFNIVPQDGQVLAVVSSILTAIGWIMMILGQLRRKDLSMGLFRVREF